MTTKPYIEDNKLHYSIYLHSDKGSNFSRFKDCLSVAGLTEEEIEAIPEFVIEKAVYMCYEVKVNIALDLTTGEYQVSYEEV